MKAFTRCPAASVDADSGGYSSLEDIVCSALHRELLDFMDMRGGSKQTFERPSLWEPQT